MSDDKELDSESFNSNYQILKKTADWLSNQKEPDIDQLVPKVEKAMKAYTICKDRLDKVQATLGQYFENEGATAGGTPSADGNGRVRPGIGPAPDDQDDEDIAF